MQHYPPGQGTKKKPCIKEKTISDGILGGGIHETAVK